jgi:uncharacterized membrane protein YhaH (DUF805 family)
LRGNVIGFDPDTNTGAISGHDGRRYDFATLDWHSQSRPKHGDLVDFIPADQRASQIYLIEPEYVAPSVAQFYFSARGRISRSQYWLKFFLPVLLIGVVLSLLQLAEHRLFSILSGVFNLVVLWPSIAILIKRIHDRNKSGWLIWALYGPGIAALLFTIGAFVAIAVSSTAGAWTLGIIAAMLWTAMVAVAIWFFVEFGCMRGTFGVNQYGPDPVPAR